MAQRELLRLRRVVVDGLFGIYDHDFRLELDHRVTLLHGPNGVGKTVVLGMIDSLLRKNFDYFQGFPFSRFRLEFHDGSAVDLEPTGEESSGDGHFLLKLSRPGEEDRSATVRRVSRAGRIAAKIDYLRPHPELSGVWIDMRYGEVLDAEGVVSRYADVQAAAPEKAPWFNDFLDHAQAHFIRAQRLVRTDWSSVPFAGRLMTSRRKSIISAVDERSEHFRKRIAETLVRYGRESQALDQTFPQRLILTTDAMAVDDLKQRMSDLDHGTEELRKIGILDETPAHPFSVDNLAGMDLRVMTLYVRDTEKKLEVLDDLAKRVRLLLEHVNQKYRHKTIEPDREHGFVAKSDKGQPLPLQSLSSGEQQELVLHYDLLFRVPSNTIVLLDEPELSLHVAWQKRFLPDLLKIVELSNFDALVATHSPYVVGDRDDLMVGLGDAR